MSTPKYKLLDHGGICTQVDCILFSEVDCSCKGSYTKKTLKALICKSDFGKIILTFIYLLPEEGRYETIRFLECPIDSVEVVFLLTFPQSRAIQYK